MRRGRRRRESELGVVKEGGRHTVAMAVSTGEHMRVELLPTPRSNRTMKWGRTIERTTERQKKEEAHKEKKKKMMMKRREICLSESEICDGEKERLIGSF